MSNPKTNETAPCVMRFGNFWCFANMPFSCVGPRNRCLVATDWLDDIVGSPAAENHRAMMRLEDVSALVGVDAMKTRTDCLCGKRMPHSIAVIPRYVDPLGVYRGGGVAQTALLPQAAHLKTSLNYAVACGAQSVMQGYTHQDSNTRSKYTSASGDDDDDEFWNTVASTVLAEDPTQWALGRYTAGLNDLMRTGYRSGV